MSALGAKQRSCTLAEIGQYRLFPTAFQLQRQVHVVNLRTPRFHLYIHRLTFGPFIKWRPVWRK